MITYKLKAINTLKTLSKYVDNVQIYYKGFLEYKVIVSFIHKRINKKAQCFSLFLHLQVLILSPLKVPI